MTTFLSGMALGCFLGGVVVPIAAYLLLISRVE